MAETLLEIKDLKKYYELKSGFLGRDRRVVKAVDGITLALKEGEILGVVGESGCGKSTLGRSILRLIEPTDGEILFDGKNIRALKKEELRQERSNMQIIFQDPGASLNPRMTVGEIIGEPIELFGTETGEAKEEKIYKLMDLVGINRSYIHRFPHEFSGGQRQRIGIARALAVDPKLIICDTLKGVFVAGGDNTYIHRNIFLSAYPAERILLTGPKDLGLHGKAHGIQFI